MLDSLESIKLIKLKNINVKIWENIIKVIKYLMQKFVNQL